MGFYEPSIKYVRINKDTGEFSIADGIDLEEVLSKLYYYELVEDAIISNEIHWKLFDKYFISCRNYDEFRRYYYAYELPIEELIKKCPEVTTRTRNAIAKAGIMKVSDLINSTVNWSWSIVDKIPGVGKKQYLLIFKALTELKYWTYHGRTRDGRTEFITEENNVQETL